jgi:hypothetical protein
MKDIIREKIIETNYFLTAALLKEDVKEIDRLRAELNNLIEQYKYQLKK